MVLYIGDPHSISLYKLHAVFDYILSVSDELFQDQSRQWEKLKSKTLMDYTNEFIGAKEKGLIISYCLNSECLCFIAQ